MNAMRFNVPLFIVTLAAIGALLGAALYIAEIDTDITRYLPRDDPVIADAGTIFKHHPLQGEMAIDLGVEAGDPDLLVRSGRYVEERLRSSELFSRVGMEALQALMPDLARHVVEHLPVLFTTEELHAHVLPMLADDRIRERLADLQSRLLGLDAIGQAALIAGDPLSMRDIVLAKAAHLAPTRDIDIYQGRLLSADGKHLLIVATPAEAGTDTAFATRLQTFLTVLAGEVRERSDPSNPVTLTPMGAYRAALDNERIARRDVQKAVGLATLGIAVLLLLAFPRPLLGLFAFLPAVAGTAAAFFVVALLHKNISIMAIGFGGAVISITVDHGIAYLLFLDQTQTTYGRSASREIWAIGLVAALTTIGAFGALNLTGFPILAQLGQFAALGIAFSFLFVHWVFPRIFPELPPARPRALPFRRLVALLPVSGRYTALAALALAGGMLFFAKPTFDARLERMNTVGRETAAAETLMHRVWGSGLFDRIFVMSTAEDPGELQSKSDRMLALVNADLQDGRLASGFLPAMVFPGVERRHRNFDDWQAFWTAERIAQTRLALVYARNLGFRDDAFAPFLKRVAAAEPPPLAPIPAAFHDLMGIAQRTDGVWMQFATLTPGPGHDPAQFHERYGVLAKIFDPGYFSEKLGQLLFSTFIKMLAVIGASVALLIFFFFLDLKLSAITLSPLLFALICTMGTLHLIGHPLDIPGLMLAIIVLGIGTDYALLLVRAYQRYGGIHDPGFERIRMAVIMAAFSTLLGFGALCLAEHSLLYSAGITSLLGVGYSLIGAFVLLPPLLARHLRPPGTARAPSGDIRQRVLSRYRALEAWPRIFARFKLKKDIMFAELPEWFARARPPRTVLDIGCGYGVPGCWVLERFPDARIYAIDADTERVRVAARAFGDRGTVRRGRMPVIPAAPEPADAALLLDVIHYLDDNALRQTLERLRAAMGTDALLIIRAVVPPPGNRTTWQWRLDALRMKWTGIRACHRPADAIAAMVRAGGFCIRHIGLSGANPELAWVIAALPANAGRTRQNGAA